MAKKSKTQRAKASAARQARKAEREQLDATEQDQPQAVGAAEEETPKKGLFKKAVKKEKPETAKSNSSDKKLKKSEEKPKKKRFQFFRDVKAELKRVTWPSRVDVMRWTGVVLVALVFFGVFVAILDNLIITPLLILVSGADPASIDWGSVFSGGDFSTDGSSAADASSGADASGDASSAADGSSDTAEPDAGNDQASEETSTEGQ